MFLTLKRSNKNHIRLKPDLNETEVRVRNVRAKFIYIGGFAAERNHIYDRCLRSANTTLASVITSPIPDISIT